MSTRAYSRSAPDGKQSLPPLQNGLLEGAKKPELMKEEYHNKGQMAHRGAVDNDGIAGIPPIVHDVLRSPGNPLDTATRAFFEPRFGYDFSHVRVHTDEQVAESARSINALAYTVGGNIVFGEGQYAPGTAAGNMLLLLR